MDLRLDVSFLDHPKIRQLADTLGDAGIIAWLRVLIYARIHAPSGELLAWGIEELAQVTKYPDPPVLLLALRAAVPGHRRGLLEVLPGGIGWRIAGWADRQPFAVHDTRHAPAAARSAAARKAGLASAAKRAAQGYHRGERGRFRPNDSTERSAERTTERCDRTPTERSATQPLVNPNAHGTATEPLSPSYKNPPPPFRTPILSPSFPDHGPKPPDPGSHLEAEYARLKAQAANLALEAAAGTISDRNRRVLAALTEHLASRVGTSATSHAEGA